MARPDRCWFPTIDAVRLAAAPAMVFVVAALDRGYQTELWQHLARGRLIAREGHVVSVDRFTFTVPGRELRDNNWLSQLLYYGLHSAGGLELVQVVNALALAAAVAGLVWVCRRESGSGRVAGALGVCAAVGLWQTLLIRPQSFSVLLFVGLSALLLRAARRPAALWAVPPVMAAWANLHGGFAIGLLLILAHGGPALLGPGAGGATRWRWLACLVGAVLATLLNPYGWGVYAYAGDLSALGVARGIEEWLPPSFDTLVGGAFIVSLAAMASLVAARWRRVTLRDACVLACFAAPACVAVRMAVWWFLAAAPVAARLLAPRTGPRDDAVPPAEADPPRRWPPAVALAGILAACVASLPWLEQHSPLMRASRAPRRVEADLDAAASSMPPGAAVFTRMEWANYLAWRLDGRGRVFVEGHVELYPDDVWAQYTTVNDARPGWRDVLDRYGVRFLVLDPTYHAALLSEVRRSGEWSPPTAAGAAVVFERRPGRRDPPAPAHAAGDFSPTN